jgi:hypothetical protein
MAGKTIPKSSSRPRLHPPRQASTRSSKFSSHRAIAEYCDDIRGVAPVRIDLD